MRIGILGAGQLGRMLALAGYPLAHQFRFLDPSVHSPAGDLAELFAASFDDFSALDQFRSGLDCVTFEFENIPVTAAEHLARNIAVYPPPEALRVSQDRVTEKEFFNSIGVPTPNFAPVSSLRQLHEAVERIGFPAVLKTRRFGYDGKGQFLIREPGTIEAAWDALLSDSLILEQFVSFERELSIIAVRGQSGECRFYPLAENEHYSGMLHRSIAPAPNLSGQTQSEGEDYARRVLEKLNYVGALAIELFQVSGPEGHKLIANEMAPRVHNTGHWTIEGAETSQFENHIRAVSGLPLGATSLRGGCSAMMNIVGSEPDAPNILAMEGVHLHLYRKKARPGRKIGHLTVQAPDHSALEARYKEIADLLENSR